MGGFIGEFLILVGSFQAFSNYAIIATIGVIFAAVYMLWMYQRVFFHKLNPKWEKLLDVNVREVIYMAPLIILVFWVGLFPETFTSYMHESVAKLVENIQAVKVAMK